MTQNLDCEPRREHRPALRRARVARPGGARRRGGPGRGAGGLRERHISMLSLVDANRMRKNRESTYAVAEPPPAALQACEALGTVLRQTFPIRSTWLKGENMAYSLLRTDDATLPTLRSESSSAIRNGLGPCKVCAGSMILAVAMAYACMYPERNL